MKITPIKRHNLPDEVIKQIQKIIIDGNLKAGDKLPPERELAKKFQVGRTTIREALKALSFAKVIIRTKEGTIVNKNVLDNLSGALNEKLIAKYIDLEDLVETRKLIEVKNACLAAQKATKEDIDILRKNLLKMKKYTANNDDSKFINTNVKFHQTIAEIAQNRVLYEIFIIVKNLLTESQKTIIKFPGIMEQSLQDHEKIYQAIKEGKAHEAEKAMLAHLEHVGIALPVMEKNVYN